MRTKWHRRLVIVTVLALAAVVVDAGPAAPSEDPASSSDDATPGSGLAGVRLTRMLDEEPLRGASSSPPLAGTSAPSTVTPAEVHPFARTPADTIGATVAHENGYDGAGTRVVVIEGGFDLTHPALAGSADPTLEACFVDSGAVDPCPDDGDGDPSSAFGAGAASNCAAVNCEYGTYAASLVLGRGGLGSPPGVAPGAELVPIRVFQTDPSGQYEFVDDDDLLAALEHVEELHGTHPVDVVALDYGEGNYGPGCSGRPNDALTAQLQHMVWTLRISIVAPAGTGGAEGQTAFPACLTEVIGVTATGAHDIVPTPANSAEHLVAAPGIDVRGAAPSGSTVLSGTAAASTQAAGAAALAEQAHGHYGPDEVQQWLAAGGPAAYGYGSPFRIDVAVSLELRPRSVFGIYGVQRNGNAIPVGTVPYRGSAGWGQSTVGAARPPVLHGGDDGFWTVTSSGQVNAIGFIQLYGDMRGRQLNAPIVAMAPTTTGRGYWLLGADGGIFSFGDAQFYGSTGGMRLNAPVTDIAATPTGRGYWLTAKDGGVFSFGDADFFGSTGGMRLNQPVVSMDATPSGKGYWLVALDGGVFSFGDAEFMGSLPGLGVTQETGYRVRAVPDGSGYYISTLEGGIYPFGSATFFGHIDAWQPTEHVVEIVLVHTGERLL